jgi:hypothetical protein
MNSLLIPTAGYCLSMLFTAYLLTKSWRESSILFQLPLFDNKIVRLVYLAIGSDDLVILCRDRLTFPSWATAPPPPPAQIWSKWVGNPRPRPCPHPAPTTILRILHRLSISQACLLCLIRCILFFTLFEKIIYCSVNQLWISCRKKNLFKRNLKFLWKSLYPFKSQTQFLLFTKLIN